jgi:Flp pilus assembly protein TadG
MNTTQTSRTLHAWRKSRGGAVTVEFALTAGLAFLFFFAAFEFSRVAMIRGTIDNAIYEGARVGIIPGATNADVEKKVREILGFSLVRAANIEISPLPIVFNSKTVSVKVDVSLDKNTFSPSQFFSGKSIVRSIQMKREASRFVTGS